MRGCWGNAGQQGSPSLIYGALNLVSSTEVVGRPPLDECFKLILVVELLVPLGSRRAGGGGGVGTHSGLSLVGRKKINLRAPKMQALMQKVTEALESCKEDSEEMAPGFSKMLRCIRALLSRRGAQTEIERVCTGIGPELLCCFDQERGKNSWNRGRICILEKINATEMLCSLFTRAWPLPYSGKIALRLPSIIF